MEGLLLTALLLAADTSGPGRGDNPSELGGVLIIVGIAATVLLVGALALYRRKGRRTSSR